MDYNYNKIIVMCFDQLLSALITPHWKVLAEICAILRTQFSIQYNYEISPTTYRFYAMQLFPLLKRTSTYL